MSTLNLKDLPSILQGVDVAKLAEIKPGAKYLLVARVNNPAQYNNFEEMGAALRKEISKLTKNCLVFVVTDEVELELLEMTDGDPDDV